MQEVVLEEQGVFSKTSRVEESSFKILFGTSGSSLFAACLPAYTYFHSVGPDWTIFIRFG